MSVVLSSYELLKGKKGKWDKYSTLVSPIQMLPKKEKDDSWKEANLDWYEHIGILQLRQKVKKLNKWYNLAEGVMDKNDYIKSESNENSDMLGIIGADSEVPNNLEFYPIIPNVINVMCGEFSKRNNRVLVKAIDDYSINEMLEQKKEMVMQTLTAKAQARIAQRQAEMGFPPESEETQQALQNVRSLPEIQEFFNKSYRGVAEQWATHELNIAEERFRLYELENIGFRDSLIADEEFWHIRLTEDDYEVELWNPMNTFYHKSPDVRYVSEGNYVGRISLMSISDVIDRLGYLMTESQIKSLERVMAPRGDFGKVQSSGAAGDPTAYYDNTKGPNDQIGSIHWNQSMAMRYAFDDSIDFLDWLKRDSDFFNQGMVRVIEVYWKSQKKVGHLKQINDLGEVFEDVVSEDFIVTEQPIYDTSINKKKTKDNLIYGQHIDWIWVNEVWKGFKVGLNYFNGTMQSSDNAMEPLYLDVRPLEFQFKGESNIYGCKLPVEGCVFSDRNAVKSSFVGGMAPFQVGYNYVNNQLMDLVADEVGNVLLFDQNMIPKSSVDGSWGKHNFVKAYQVMKNFGFMPIDTSLSNTDTQINWNQTQSISMEKTNQIASRLKLAEYFKMEAFAVVGITPQRLGDVGVSESATGVQVAQSNSYTQTEMAFVKHMNWLMPRVKQMMLNAAQYVRSQKKNIRMYYMDKNEENAFFEIEGVRLLLADFGVYCTTKSDVREVLGQLKQLAINNNTSNASMADLAQIIESNSVSEIIAKLKDSQQRQEEQIQQQQQHEQELQQQQLQAAQQARYEQWEHEDQMEERKMANQRYIAEINAVAKGTAMTGPDSDGSGIPDALEVAKFNAELGKHSEDIILKRTQENNKSLKDMRESQIKAQQLKLQKEQMLQDAKQKEADRKVERENMANDEKIAKINLRGRQNKPK